MRKFTDAGHVPRTITFEIGSSPLFTFDRTTSQNNYVWNASLGHPQIAPNPPTAPAFGTAGLAFGCWYAAGALG